MAFDIGSFLTQSATNLVKGISDIAHSWINTNKDKQLDEQAAKDLEFKIQQYITENNERMIQEANQAQAAEDTNVTSRWQSDMSSDSWLSKNVRPMALISLLLFTFILILADSFHFRFQVSQQWITVIQDLLMTTFIAYFSSRGIEKITSINKKNDTL